MPLIDYMINTFFFLYFGQTYVPTYIISKELFIVIIIIIISLNIVVQKIRSGVQIRSEFFIKTDLSARNSLLNLKDY